jgi:hypothetical protein
MERRHVRIPSWMSVQDNPAVLPKALVTGGKQRMLVDFIGEPSY